ncbi:MAG TPA: hypothetical protein VJM78_01480 [Rhizomicrobium sp.]|nr:hypothetical protein [Rhizomicrobium sp.]
MGVKNDRRHQIVDIKGKIAGAAKLHEGLLGPLGCRANLIRRLVRPITAENQALFAKININDPRKEAESTGDGNQSSQGIFHGQIAHLDLAIQPVWRKAQTVTIKGDPAANPKTAITSAEFPQHPSYKPQCLEVHRPQKIWPRLDLVYQGIRDFGE